jgi:hypothetical protein
MPDWVSGQTATRHKTNCSVPGPIAASQREPGRHIDQRCPHVLQAGATHPLLPEAKVRISVELQLLKCVYAQNRNCAFAYCAANSKYAFTFPSEYGAEVDLPWRFLVIH